MNKLKSAILVSVFAVPLFTGFFQSPQKPTSFMLFPEITFSSCADFDNENSDEKVIISQQKDRVEVKFKIIEWIKSVF